MQPINGSTPITLIIQITKFKFLQLQSQVSHLPDLMFIKVTHCIIYSKLQGTVIHAARG